MMRFLLHIVLLLVSITTLKGIESYTKGSYIPRIEVITEEVPHEQLRHVLEQAAAVPTGSFESPTGSYSLTVRVQVKPTSARHHTWGTASVWQENRIAIHNDGGLHCLQTATTATAHCEPCWLCRLII